MSRKKGQTYTAEQKTKIVLELLKEEATAAQLASKYKVTTQTLGAWKKKFLENASLALEPAKAVQEFKEEIKSKEAEIEELQKQLGKSVVEKEWLAKKLESLDLSNRKSLVDSKLKDLSVTRQCELLQLSRASYYYNPAPMSDANLKIMHAIDEIATDNSEYGYRYIHQHLLENGYSIGKDRVLKYMRILGIRAIYPTKKKLTSIQHPEHKKYPYLLSQYHNAKKQVIVNSPGEVQYSSHEHTKMLKDHSIEISMNGKGRSIDNIAIERFFRTLKHGNIYINDYQTIKQLKEGVKNYIYKYNFKRFHSSINYQKPMNVYLEYLRQAG
jgi:putative transposase